MCRYDVRQSHQKEIPVKIEKTNKPLPPSTLGDASRSPSGKAAAQSTANSGVASETNVHLGSTSAKLRNLESTIASTPVVDAKKVAEIKLAISEGRFQVNASAVADSLISTVQELVNASKP
jgi:negative regulator of flagellin synthesis FlgM